MRVSGTIRKVDPHPYGEEARLRPNDFAFLLRDKNGDRKRSARALTPVCDGV